MNTNYPPPPTFAAARKDAKSEPIPFFVDGEPDVFLVPRPLPAFPLLDMAAEAQDGDEGAALAAFLRFLRGAVAEADWVRFRDAVTRARWDATDLLPLVRYLVQEATGRPTTPPSDSRGWSDGGGRWQSPEVSPNGGGARLP